MDSTGLLSQTAPDFTLFDTKGLSHTLSAYRGKIVILNFWSGKCPWVETIDQQLIAFLKEWREQVILLAIASNAGEDPGHLTAVAVKRGIPVVLLDPEQQIADLYMAVTTPHFFVIDTQGCLRYQGAFNDATFRQRQPAQNYVAQAVAALSAGRMPDPASIAPFGCGILRHLPDYSTG